MISQLLVLLIIVWYLVVKWRNRHITKLAEQLKSSMMNLPLIGHVYVLLGNGETTMKGLQRMFRDAIECGGTVAHWCLNKLYITVADPEIADIILKNCLEKDDLMKFFHVVSGDGSIFTSVKKWRPRRKILNPTFSMTNLTRYVEVFASQSSILAEKLKKLEGQDPSPMWKLVSSYAMNVACDYEIDRFKPFVELVLKSVSEEREKVLREECIVLVGAGTETSAISIGYMLVMLATHPEVQEKAYRELKEILSDSNRPVQADDLHRLKYLEAVIRETLRLYPPIPVIVRKIEKDIKLPSGVVVPAGCGAAISIWGIHHNPAIWGTDVEEFRPERFLDSTTPKHPAAFIPFSYGPRNCAGFQYAMMSMKTVLCTVLQKYRLLPASEDQIPLRVEFKVVIRDIDQYRVGIEKRQ